MPVGMRMEVAEAPRPRKVDPKVEQDRKTVAEIDEYIAQVARQLPRALKPKRNNGGDGAPITPRSRTSR